MPASVEKQLVKALLDAALINAAQAAEHYEIVRYGSLIAWAKQTRPQRSAPACCRRRWTEEKATDKKLNMLAEEQIRVRRRTSGTDDRSI